MVKKKRGLFGWFAKFFWQFIIMVIIVFVFLTTILPYFLPLEKVIPVEQVNEILGKQAGLKLSLNGRTRISILPFVGFSAKNIEIVNIREEFKANPNVIYASKIEIKLAVFPLFFGNFVVKNIFLDGANINVNECNSKMNVFSPGEGNVVNAENVKDVKTFNAMDYVKSFGIKKFAIKNSNFLYAKCNSAERYEIKNFDASVEMPSFEKDILVKFGMIVNDVKVVAEINSSNLKDVLEKKSGILKINLDGDFGKINGVANYNFDSKFQTFFNRTKFEITGKDVLVSKISQMAGIKNESLNGLAGFSLAINGEIENTKIAVQKLKFEMDNMVIDGGEIGVSIPDRANKKTISASGNLSIVAQNIHSFAKKMNLKLDIVKKYPAKIEGNFFFSYLNNVLKLEDKSNLQIDTTTLKLGLVADVMSVEKSVTFSVASNVLNVDEYLNLQQKQTEPVNEKKQTDEKYIPIKDGLSKDVIHMPELGGMIVDGVIAIDKIIAFGADIDNFSYKLRIRNNEISSKIGANVFDGSANVELALKEQNKILSGLKVDILLKNFEISKLLQVASMKKNAEGKINGVIKFNSNSNNIYDIVMLGNGVAEIASKNFTLVGFDLDNLIKDTISDYKSLLSIDAAKRYISPAKKTTVDEINIKAQIAQGIVTNEMFAQKDSLSLEGNGNVNLYNEKIDYRILPKSQKISLPAIVIKRTIEDPLYMIDPTLYVRDQTKKALHKQINDNPLVKEKLEKFNNLINNFKL